MSAVAHILFFVGGLIAVWNALLWLMPRGFPIVWGLPHEGSRYDGATIRHHYRWANGVPIVGSMLVLAALALDGFQKDMLVRAPFILLLDPRGLVWEVVADLRHRRQGDSRPDDTDTRD